MLRVIQTVICIESWTMLSPEEKKTPYENYGQWGKKNIFTLHKGCVVWIFSFVLFLHCFLSKRHAPTGISANPSAMWVVAGKNLLSLKGATSKFVVCGMLRWKTLLVPIKCSRLLLKVLGKSIIWKSAFAMTMAASVHDKESRGPINYYTVGFIQCGVKQMNLSHFSTFFCTLSPIICLPPVAYLLVFVF